MDEPQRVRILILTGRKLEPISKLNRKLPALKCSDDGIAVANLAARRVHDVAAALHHGYQTVIKHMLGLGM